MDHIIPAIAKDVPEKDLSPAELQKMLHNWFRDKGLLTDLRCHLRLQMIEILRSKSAGRNVLKQPFKSATLADQSVNLIIAEYLIRNQCHYSLSMFSTEVSLTNNLLEFSTSFDSSNMYQNWQFTKENLLNILELNGISKHSQQCEQILSIYYGCRGNTSLLNTLIKSLCDISNNTFTPTVTEQIQISSQGTEKFGLIKLLKNILQSTHLSPKVIAQIVSICKKHYGIEISKKDEEFRSFYDSLKLELTEKDTKLEELSKINDSLKNKVIKKINENRDLKTNLHNLLMGEKLLKREYKKLLRARDVDKYDQEVQCEDLEGYGDDKSILELDEKTTNECLLDHCNDMCKDALKVIEHLKQDNYRLSKDSVNQKMEIVNLTSKCNNLLDEYNAAQTKLSLLSAKITQRNIISEPTSPTTSEHNSLSAESKHETVASCESITDDILVQARLKLKQLEKESEEIDSRFKKFITLTN